MTKLNRKISQETHSSKATDRDKSIWHLTEPLALVLLHSCVPLGKGSTHFVLQNEKNRLVQDELRPGILHDHSKKGGGSGKQFELNLHSAGVDLGKIWMQEALGCSP